MRLLQLCKMVSRDARLSQNLALAYRDAWPDLGSRTEHWIGFWKCWTDEFFPPRPPGYKNRLAFECLHPAWECVHRSAERWTQRSDLPARAHQIHGDNRYFGAAVSRFQSAQKPEDVGGAGASPTATIRPARPANGVFELELIEINNLDNCNRVLAGWSAPGKYPDDARVAERQAQMLARLPRT